MGIWSAELGYGTGLRTLRWNLFVLLAPLAKIFCVSIDVTSFYLYLSTLLLYHLQSSLHSLTPPIIDHGLGNQKSSWNKYQANQLAPASREDNRLWTSNGGICLVNLACFIERVGKFSKKIAASLTTPSDVSTCLQLGKDNKSGFFCWGKLRGGCNPYRPKKKTHDLSRHSLKGLTRCTRQICLQLIFLWKISNPAC